MGFSAIHWLEARVSANCQCNRGTVIIDFLQACHGLCELSHARTLHCVCAGLSRHELQRRHQSDIQNYRPSFKRLRRRQRAQDPDHAGSPAQAISRDPDPTDLGHLSLVWGGCPISARPAVQPQLEAQSREIGAPLLIQWHKNLHI